MDAASHFPVYFCHKIARILLYLYLLAFPYILLSCPKLRKKLTEQAKQAWFYCIYLWLTASQLSLKSDWYCRFVWDLVGFYVAEFLGVNTELKKIFPTLHCFFKWEPCARLCKTYDVNDKNAHSAILFSYINLGKDY